MAAEDTTDPTSDEELEDQDDTEVDEETQDETDGDGEEDTDEEEDETDDESDDSDEEEDDSEEDEDFQKRFTQFKGDTPTEYLKNLEDGYAESSKEAVKLSKELKELKPTVERIQQLIATNPELAEAIKGAEGQPAEAVVPKDPALQFAESQMKATWTKEYTDFAENHPEIETDPVLADQLETKLKVVRRIVQEEEGRLVNMGEGLEMAWKLLGKDTDKQERIRMASKDAASQGKAKSGTKSKVAKSKFSEAQIEVHMDMTGLDRPAAIKQLSTYVK